MKKLLIVVAISTLCSATANASVVNSLSNATSVSIPNVNLLGYSQSTTFSGITYTSTQPSAFGYTGTYGFNTNGNWSGTPMIGLDRPTGYFQLQFSNAVSGFLADTNWTTTNSNLNATIQAFDASMNLLESITLENGANLINPGYLGFSRASDDISFIRFSNEYIGIRNISVADEVTSAVPEPETYAMLLAGLGLMAGVARRRKQA